MEARLNEKETEYKDISEANKALELEIEASKSALEAARAQAKAALMKVGCMTEEVEKSNRKAARVAEQLEAAQAAHAEMEAELRKLKVLWVRRNLNSIKIYSFLRYADS